MTYVVEIQNEHALPLLRNLEKMGAITLKKTGRQTLRSKELSGAAQGLRDAHLHAEGKLPLPTWEEFINESNTQR